MQDKVDILNDISIAQKTVNTRGTKELLVSKVELNGSIPTKNGSSTATATNQTINLIDDIEKYNFLNISIALDTATTQYKGKVNTLLVNNIVYNDTNVAKVDNGSLFQLGFDLFTGGEYSYGYAHFVLRGWFKNSKQLYIDAMGLPLNDPRFNKISIDSILGVNIENVTIDPVEYVNTTQNIEDTPVGNIISVMGKTAPGHYLICDGSVHNITDYPYLSQYIKDQFGTFNFFGGDGTATFALPDLRNEFLRGYHGDKAEKQSGEIGVHQEPTNHINFYVDQGSHIFLNGDYNKFVSASNVDKAIYTSTLKGWTNNGSLGTWAAGGDTKYTSRPTNTAVLYCIKYEPTFFMSIQGLIEETVLWEGNIGTIGTTTVFNSINLNDSYTNYDKIGVLFGYTPSSNAAYCPQYRELIPSQIAGIIESSISGSHISLNWGYGSLTDFTAILKTSTPLRLDISQGQSTLYKVIGLKYKTFQN